MNSSFRTTYTVARVVQVNEETGAMKLSPTSPVDGENEFMTEEEARDLAGKLAEKEGHMFVWSRTCGVANPVRMVDFVETPEARSNVTQIKAK